MHHTHSPFALMLPSQPGGGVEVQSDAAAAAVQTCGNHRNLTHTLLQHVTNMQVGCGAGNTLFPLLELNPRIRAYACDFAPAAVDLVRGSPAFDASRVTAFVADISQVHL